MAVLVPARGAPVAPHSSRRWVSTRDDLVQLLKVPAEKIDVVPGGCRRTPTAEATHGPELRARLGLGELSVVLTASAKRPHKNLAPLLEAWALLPSGDRPVLVLPGYPTPHERELRERAAALGIEGDTRFAGWVSTADLEGLYSTRSSCFVYPSLYEGFGLPVLEAMARGVPVACSDRASLSEVAGDGGADLRSGGPSSDRATRSRGSSPTRGPASVFGLRDVSRRAGSPGARPRPARSGPTTACARTGGDDRLDRRRRPDVQRVGSDPALPRLSG